MHDLNSAHATLYNRWYRRYGALFQGRFKAILVQQEGYGGSLSRYVHLNPVRAAAVERPENYRWTSYRDYLNPKDSPAWLDWETVLGEIGGDPNERRAQYVRFVQSGMDEQIESPLAGVVAGVLLGSANWVERMKHRIGAGPEQRGVPARRRLAVRPSLAQIHQTVCGAFGVEAHELTAARRHGNDARVAAIYLGREVGALPVGQLAEYFGSVSVSAVSKLVRQATARRQRDRAWDRLLKDLQHRLNGQK